MNENHYQEIIKALEFYNRFHTGQLSMVLEKGDYNAQKDAEAFVNEMLGIQQ